MTEAIILAGGLGTRLRTIVPDVPKPMAPINSRPFLEYQMDYWIDQGIERFILSVGYKHNSIVDYFGHHYRNVQIDYVIEEAPLGTGGALLLAAKKLRDQAPFLLLNGDTYFAVNLQVLREFASQTKADWCFSLFRTNEGDRYLGMDVASTGQISSLEAQAGQASYLANGGVYFVNPQALNYLFSNTQISLENDIFPLAMQSNQRLFGLEFDDPFIDIGLPADYNRAAKFLLPSNEEIL